MCCIMTSNSSASHLEGLLAAGRCDYAIALLAQDLPQQVQCLDVIIHDQDVGVRRFTAWSFFSIFPVSKIAPTGVSGGRRHRKTHSPRLQSTPKRVVNRV